MKCLLSAFVLATSLCASLSAQTVFTVSPVTATSTEGSGANAFPWSNTTIRRYQQIHSDLGSGVKLIKELSFRQNGGTANRTGTRVVDVELQIADANDYSTISNTFSANFKSKPTTVITRKKINFGPQGQASSPSPFTGMNLALATTYLHTGANSLIWEAKVYSNVVSGTWSAVDVDASSGGSASFLTTGPGCVATGRAAAMSLNASASDRGGIFSFGAGLGNGPSSTPYFLAIGVTNPGWTVPGWCGNLYTDMTVLTPAGTTNAAGRANYWEQLSLSTPNTFNGATFYIQALALDPGLSSSVKVCNSNGESFAVPMPNTTKVVKVARMFNNAGGTTATTGLRFTTSSMGYGVVTRFRH